MIDFVATFIFFFAAIDPIGTIPIFIEVTRQEDISTKRKIAIKATLTAAAILLFFVIAGEFILNEINIPLPAFQIAGGIVLFLFALSMIFGESKPEEEVKMISDSNEKAIFPLAVPSIAGPGPMLGAVLRTENASFSFWEQLQITMTMMSVLLVVLVFMFGSSYIYRLIGNGGASVASRVMGMILASMATESVLAGIKAYFAF